jgi:DNA-binding CsgD family transcriptional regulator
MMKMHSESHPNHSDILKEADVRAMIRLLASVAVTKGGVVAQKRRLVEGLAELVGADRWMWNVTRFDGSGPAVAVSLLHNFTEKQFAALVEANANGDMADFDKNVMALNGQMQHWTRHANQILTDEESQHTSLPKVWEKMDELDGECVFTSYAVEGHDDLRSALGLHRAANRPPFTQREIRIIHILTSEVDWLHMMSVPDEDGQSMATLTPRLQSVLHLLMDGHNAKRIAYLLKLSDHTVRGYIKDIYRHFQVSSRAELMRRFLVGDGGDIPFPNSLKS